MSCESIESLEEEGAEDGMAGVLVVEESFVRLLLPPLLLLLLAFSKKVSTILLDEESAMDPRVESASAFMGIGFSSLSTRESVTALLVLSVLSDGSSFLWLNPWLKLWSSFGVCFEIGFLRPRLSFLASDGMELRDLVGELSLGLILSTELTRSFSFSLLLSR